jgi:hypothetical protein
MKSSNFKFPEREGDQASDGSVRSPGNVDLPPWFGRKRKYALRILELERSQRHTGFAERTSFLASTTSKTFLTAIAFYLWKSL